MADGCLYSYSYLGVCHIFVELAFFAFHHPQTQPVDPFSTLGCYDASPGLAVDEHASIPCSGLELPGWSGADAQFPLAAAFNIPA